MANKLDTRQSIVRESLPQIVATSGQNLNTVLQNVNMELTPPLVLTPTDTPSKLVQVGNIVVTNNNTGKKRTVPALSSGIPNFTSGTIQFPASSPGNITFSTGGSASVPLTCPANQFNKVLIYLDTLGNLGASVGTPAASAAAVIFPPTINNTFAIGYILISSNGSGLLNDITMSMIYQFEGGGGAGGSGGGASLLDPNFDETFIYYTRSDFSIDKKTFFGSTTGTESILGLGKVVLGIGQNFISSNILGPVFLADNPVINTAQVRLLYTTGKVDTNAAIQVSIDGGSSWTSSYQAYSSGNFVIADFTLPAGSTSSDVRIKVTSATASSELLGFGVNLVQDQVDSWTGEATQEVRIISALEASSGTITLTQVKFTPGTNQLHCNYQSHDIIAPTFLELGGGVVQFPANFFVAGDTVKFHVGYGIVNTSNAPTTINHVVSANTTMGSLQIPTGYTLDKPYMEIPAGATVTGAGNVSTDKAITGAGVLATTGTVLSRGVAPTQPKYDVLTVTNEANIAKFANAGIVQPGTSAGLVSAAGLPGRTDGQAVASGYVGEVKSGSTISTTVLTTSFQNISTINLTAGIWMLYYELAARYSTGATNGNNGYTTSRITASDGTTLIGNSCRLISPPACSNSASSGTEGCLRATEVLTLLGSADYIVQAKKSDGAGTGSGAIYNEVGLEQSTFKAIRIA